MRALVSLMVSWFVLSAPVWAQFGGSNNGEQGRSKKPPTVALSTKDDIKQIIPQIAPDSNSSERQNQKLFARLLSQKISISFHDIPLRDAVKKLAEQTELAIRIDERALDDVGLDSSEKVSIELNDVSAYSGLKWMLVQLDLTFIVDVDDIIITTPDVAESHLVNRFYAIPELLSNPAYYDGIIEVLTTTVEPDSWEDLGGPGSIAPYMNGLMISTTDEIHIKLDRLFVGLRHLQTFPSNPYPTASYRVSLFPKQEQEILSQLQSIEAKFEPKAVSLEAFLKQLRQQAPCPVFLDQRALEDMGVDQDTVTVTPPAQSTSLKRILDVATKPVELTWFVAGDLIVLTTQDEVEAQLEVELYPVRDLVWKGIDVTNPQIIKRLQEGPWENDSIVSLPDYDALIEMLTTTIEPDSWEELGGPGSLGIFDMRADCLVIAQTQSIHESIQTALTQVREQQQPVDIEKLLADIEKHEATLLTRTYSALRESADTPLLTREEMQRIAQRIKQQIAPESWSDESVFIESLGDRLVIRHRRDVHRQVEDYLQERSIIPPQQVIGYSGCVVFPSNQRYLPPQQNANPSAQPTPAVPQASAQGGGGVF